jgi:hypothetical protein
MLRPANRAEEDGYKGGVEWPFQCLQIFDLEFTFNQCSESHYATCSGNDLTEI